MIESLGQVSETHPEILSPEFKSSLIDTLTDSMHQDLDHMWARFEKGLPVLIHTGFQGHAMNILVIDKYLIICNRGALSSMPIEAYEFDRSKMTKETLARMQDVRNYHLFTAVVYYKFAFGGSVNAQQDDVTSVLQKYNEFLDYQSLGNCAWESLEAAMYVLFVIPQILENKKMGRPLDESVPEAISRFDDWLKMTELQILEQYLVRYESGQSTAIDEKFMDEIFTNSGKILEERLSNFQKYEKSIIYMFSLSSSCWWH